VTGTRHPFQKEILDYHGWDGYWDAFFVGEDVFYGHVLGFKGLERPVVVLAVNGLRDQSRGREYLYVGLSRARSCLVLCGDLDQIAEVGGAGLRRRLQASMEGAALHVCATPINRAGQYTTLADATRDRGRDDRRRLFGWFRAGSRDARAATARDHPDQ